MRNPVTGEWVAPDDVEQRIILAMHAREQRERHENRHEQAGPVRQPEPTSRPTGVRAAIQNLPASFLHRDKAPERVNAPDPDWPAPQRPDYAAQRARQEKDARNRQDRALRLRKRQIREAQLGRRLPGPRGIVDR